jgi:hypothetical protein
MHYELRRGSIGTADHAVNPHKTGPIGLKIATFGLEQIAVRIE